MSRKAWGGLAVGLLAVGLIPLMLGPKKNDRLCLRNSDLGEVSISTKALEELIQCTCRTVPGLIKVRPQFIKEKEGLVITVHALLKGNARDPNSEQALGMRIKEAIEGLVDLPVGQVNICLRSLTS